MRKTFWSLAIVFAFVFACFAQDGETVKKTETPTEQAQTAIEFSAELLNTIDTEKSKRNDDFQLRLNEEVKIGDKTLERGTKINGRVVRSKKMSENDDSSMVSLYIGSVQEKNDYFRFFATVVSIAPANQPAAEELQYSSSPNFLGATIISTKGKNLRFDEGTILRLKVGNESKDAQ